MAALEKAGRKGVEEDKKLTRREYSARMCVMCDENLGVWFLAKNVFGGSDCAQIQQLEWLVPDDVDSKIVAAEDRCGQPHGPGLGDKPAKREDEEECRGRNGNKEKPCNS